MSMFLKLFRAGLAMVSSLCATLCASAACAGPPALEAKIHVQPDADTYVELGTWFGDRHQYPCAVEAYQAALKLEPGSAKLAYLLGLGLYYAGRPEEAVTALQQSIQLMPEVLKPHLILAGALNQLHRPQEAMTEWEAALKIDPTSTIALDGLSKSFIAQGDFRSVIGLLHSAPPSEDLTLDLAHAYDMAGMLDEASKALEQAVHAHPASLPLSEALVMILARQAHFEQAAELAAKRIRLHPRDFAAQELYLHVLVLNDDVKTAAPLARKLMALKPHEFGVLYLNGVLERESGQFPAARKHLEEAVALDPNHYNSRYNLGVVLAELGDPKGAREQLEKALALGATEPQIRFKLASVLRSLGETQLAQEQLKLYQQEEKAKADRTLAASKAAQAGKEFDNKNFAQAAALYRDALTAYPNDALSPTNWRSLSTAQEILMKSALSSNKRFNSIPTLLSHKISWAISPRAAATPPPPKLIFARRCAPLPATPRRGSVSPRPSAWSLVSLRPRRQLPALCGLTPTTPRRNNSARTLPRRRPSVESRLNELPRMRCPE